jgi:hypothetical protein
MAKTFPAPAGFTPGPRPDIALTPVTSNQVKAIGYNPATKTLAVQFNHGAGHIYHYPNVTAEQHAEFVGAKSIGAHFGQHIKPLAFEKYEAPKAEEAAAT